LDRHLSAFAPGISKKRVRKWGQKRRFSGVGDPKMTHFLSHFGSSFVCFCPRNFKKEGQKMGSKTALGPQNGSFLGIFDKYGERGRSKVPQSRHQIFSERFIFFKKYKNGSCYLGANGMHF